MKSEKKENTAKFHRNLKKEIIFEGEKDMGLKILLDRFTVFERNKNGNAALLNAYIQISLLPRVPTLPPPPTPPPLK